MKALVKTKKGKGYLEIEDVPIPEINDNEVLIKVHYSGICGTDIHIFSDQFPIYYPPVILGHEFSGEIVHIEGRATSWKVGDRVVVECQSLVCGECRYCRTGHPEACRQAASRPARRPGGESGTTSRRPPRDTSGPCAAGRPQPPARKPLPRRRAPSSLRRGP